MSSGEALSILWTMERSWNVALPAPPPPPAEVAPVFVTPHENESTSISSLCLASSDSPLMSPIFAKMSDAIWILLKKLRPANQMIRRPRPRAQEKIEKPTKSNRRSVRVHTKGWQKRGADVIAHFIVHKMRLWP